MTRVRQIRKLNLIFVVPSIMLYSGEVSPTRCNNCVFYSQWLYSTCFGWQSHPSSGVQCCIWPQVEIRYFSRHSAGSTTQNNKTEITYNSTTIELLYYWQIYNLRWGLTNLFSCYRSLWSRLPWNHIDLWYTIITTVDNALRLWEICKNTVVLADRI